MPLEAQQDTTQNWRFGVFEVDARNLELRRSGVLVKVREQSFRVLVYLIDHAGEIVSREDLYRALWPADTFVDFDHSLNTAVKKLRDALGDDADAPIYIETVPRRGYRFVAPVSKTGQQENEKAEKNSDLNDGRPGVEIITRISAPISASSAIVAPSKRKVLIWIAPAAVIVVALLIYWRHPAGVPTVSNYAQLTRDGRPKELIATDGARIYLISGTDLSHTVSQISISAGNPAPIALPSPDMTALSLSPDEAELLLEETHGLAPGALWAMPLLGGSPRRLGDTVGSAGAWSPDGKMLAYGYRGDVFLAKSDGSEPRPLAAVKDAEFVRDLVWFPDSTSLRFVVYRAGQSGLWEVSARGTGLHRVFAEPNQDRYPYHSFQGSWTANGRCFIYGSAGQIWALPQRDNFPGTQPKPVQLTFGPMWMSSPLASKDGRKIFAVGRIFRGELVRYDVKSAQYQLFLGGISAEFVDLSKDGQWVAYVTYPDGVLWRSRLDGSDRLQLTYPPGYVVNPRWSPDGQSIVFFKNLPDGRSRILEVSPQGGVPHELMPENPNSNWDPNWSPDGKKLVFAEAINSQSAFHIFDVATHKVSMVPGSQGFNSPRWSPDGRFLVGTAAQSTVLMGFDFQSQKWRALSKGSVSWPNFSKDSQYVYVLGGRGASAVLKIRFSDGKTERIADLKDFAFTGYYNDSSLSLAADSSPVLLRDAGSSDVYALDWHQP